MPPFETLEKVNTYTKPFLKHSHCTLATNLALSVSHHAS